MRLDEIAAAVGGQLVDVGDPGRQVRDGVEFDSRRIGPDGLFVALPGEHVDGHDYAAAAYAAGAAATLAARPVGVPAIVVADVVHGLGELAHAVLDRLPSVTVIGVTGSSGKTTTKDLLAHVLSVHGETVAPPGSFNNEIGHPWTVLRASESTRYLLLECSARGIGHIAALCRIAPPQLGIVLNVGSAHVGEFGSRERVAQAKGELVEALPADGVAVLNADDPLVRAMAARTAARVVLVGESVESDVRATDVSLDAAGRASYQLHAKGTETSVRLALHGEHQVANSLAAAAVALELGLTPEALADALATAGPASRWRMEVTEREDGVTVINDAYNANPESMRAALKTLATIGRGRRTWAVLGVMAELGDDADEAHDALGRLAVRLDVNRLVVVGAEARRIHAGAVLEGSWGRESLQVPDVAAAVELLRAELAPGDVVLIKASRAAGLERVAQALAGGAA